ncbi:bifunctional [glutamate--ammonia ligase]-adenylyl-L-tyrosine phosphorylase/[glutamate--ammonia-ligase] adenylyltransferase [Reinekea marinisedimentorum]|uniref:Bifunctional glutamine synthetase adenylyltransferase/adenylyl-removing enzyme n=1 Tax=Reinekea marinisedimentorum TaxID=230495 RepID=A0A4R3I0V4_9GAMM|nr:bifunctional [glutamate--ammonia ligase]-adenylyl-L-tyrosine phosphorylase/[glutamate--ammonia-ligase] adenylyltransferase [Reinekea marinisedimentorum]TCS38205.1 glutamate-ammonia-ligase adenylyltransferase [Reinekea marinisedimentorum]
MPKEKQLKKELERLQSQSQFCNLEPQHQPVFERMCLASPWLFTWLKGQTDWVAFLGFVEADANPQAALQEAAQTWTIKDEARVMKDLRVWRNRYMARLIARDILQLNHVRDTARAVSDLADAAIRQALAWSTEFWQASQGAPAICPHSDQPEQMIVIAMGKHGAQELNLSSDIDLIFAYPTQSETTKGKPHELFFTRVGRKLIQLLDQRTADGFVFRVDMRLRPWGQSGALVSNFRALQNYYLQQGRFWERFAMVKARAVTGAVQAQQALEDILTPFVYRRYVDYQAVGALRDLKQKIQAEVRRQNLERNIKLGRGGIREIEFIAQVFQLIRGGQDEILQQRGTWPVLASLGDLGLLPDNAVTELVEAYDFLRDLEHRIQAINDEQTQVLPVDDAALERLAISAGAESADQLLTRLTDYRERVHKHFSYLIQDDSPEYTPKSVEQYESLWLAESAAAEGELAAALLAFRALPGVDRLSETARHNLDVFMPLLWANLAEYDDAPRRFEAIRPILESILRRTSYFVLLAENPVAVRELVKLAPQSVWIAENLQEKPFLLDELTDIESLYRLPNKVQLMDELHQMLIRVPEEDLERQMELLRHFRHGKALRAAACEIAGQLPLMKISDYLAWVAEVVVEQALALAWQQMVAKNGRPSKENGDWCDTDFGVIAYGKMGGIELSYQSDLDLVFIHNAALNGQTEGPKKIDNSVFMARLGQKLIHLMSSVTPSGMLYEVDMRLRPSGNSGMLVSGLAAFKKYQLGQAWTWEHQALARARFIAGDPELKVLFDELRAEILCLPRETQKLRTEVLEMRQKMRDHLSTPARGDNPEENFHLKHDSGGIVDLEFLVQFCVLAYARQHPNLAIWSDNVRTLDELLAAGIVDADDHNRLLSAYLQLRTAVHRAILDGHSTSIERSAIDDKLNLAIEHIRQAWRKYVEC